MERERLTCQLNIESAVACARLAEGLAWKGFDEFLLAGSGKVCTPSELHARAKKVHVAWTRKQKGGGVEIGPVSAKLKKENTGSLSYARLLIERVEALAWAAGVRRSFPPHDSRVEAGFSFALRTVMAGGVPASAVRPRSEKEVRAVRRKVAAWWWRTRAEEFRARFTVLAPDLQRGAAKIVKLRGEFTKLVGARRLVKMCAGDFELSGGGPLSNNYFSHLAMELDDLHRPRYLALAWAETGVEADPTMASLWEEATGKVPNAKGWSDVPA